MKFSLNKICNSYMSSGGGGGGEDYQWTECLLIVIARSFGTITDYSTSAHV